MEENPPPPGNQRKSAANTHNIIIARRNAGTVDNNITGDSAAVNQVGVCGQANKAPATDPATNAIITDAVNRPIVQGNAFNI